MQATAKVAISLPREMLDEIDQRCQLSEQSRSHFIREAVAAYLRRERHQKAVEQYIRGYTEQPELAEDIELARQLAPGAFSPDESWE